MDERKSKHYLKYALQTYREGWKLASGALILQLAGMLVFDVGAAYAVMFINRAIVSAVTESKSVSVAISCIIGLFLIALSSKLLQVVQKLVDEKIKVALRLKDENNIMRKVERVQYELLERPSYYDTYSMVNADYSASVLQFVSDVHNVVIGIVNAVISIGLLLSYRAWIGIAFSLAEILYMFFYLKYYNYQCALRRKSAPDRRRLTKLKGLLFAKERVVDVKLNDAGDMLTDKMNESHDKLYRAYCQKNRAAILLDSWYDAYHNIRDAAVMLVYLLKALSGAITIADYTFIVSLITNAEDAASTPVTYAGILLDDLQYVSDYYDFINLSEERTGRNVARDKKTPGEIALENFTFEYPESGTAVLKNISLTINPGEVIAIVGENGAGKTTLVKNIMGLYDTYDGKLRMDGVDYKEYSAREIYDCFSVVMQDYMKYPFTLRDNITISDTDAENVGAERTSDESLDMYMDKADGGNIAKRLKNGYDTYMNKEMDEDGADLSEGQWQKVMLARALYRDRGIVIFDEPTASLDPIAEEAFYRNIIDNANGRTVIVVTHRLACTASADRIIVMRDGEIAESGSHAELMHKNGLYAEMYKVQSAGYAEGMSIKEG